MTTFSFAIPPGETIREAMEHERITEGALRLHLQVTEEELKRIFDGEMEIGKALSVRLADILGGDPQFWRNVYMFYELARESRERSDKAKKIRFLFFFVNIVVVIGVTIYHFFF